MDHQDPDPGADPAAAETLVDAVADLLARQRHGSGVTMDGRHLPHAGEQDTARRFVRGLPPMPSDASDLIHRPVGRNDPDDTTWCWADGEAWPCPSERSERRRSQDPVDTDAIRLGLTTDLPVTPALVNRLLDEIDRTRTESVTSAATGRPLIRSRGHLLLVMCAVGLRPEAPDVGGVEQLVALVRSGHLFIADHFSPATLRPAVIESLTALHRDGRIVGADGRLGIALTEAGHIQVADDPELVAEICAIVGIEP
jgi:hypothetical protein